MQFISLTATFITQYTFRQDWQKRFMCLYMCIRATQVQWILMKYHSKDSYSNVSF